MNSSAYEINVDSQLSQTEENVWYKLSPTKELPDSRVGHTTLFCKKDRKLILVGGATPHSLYNEVWVLSLKYLVCKRLEVLGDFEARYEHSAFFPSETEEETQDSTRLWIFAGANTEENKNDLWELDLKNQQWISLSQSGEIPSTRTYHATSVVLNNKFLVFSGGAKGVEAVTDLKTYQLDMSTREWSVLPTKGEPPQPRQGHVLIAVQDKLYCHGGMSGTYLYDDLHVLDADGTWTSVSFSQQPSGRAAHGAAYHNRFIYIFGGLGNSGALNDMWRLCIDTMIWEEVVVSGSVPPRRLDFAFSLVELPEKFEKKSEDDSEEHGARVQVDSGDGAEQHFPYLLLHGGMDETGHIYDDFYVMSLRSA
ncbi:rab9 effector protein with kelch motifs-like [Periplaneta americana]|uniref:rab9 effector protein with kelch motifs-like n=1 Tax=Periplaneta americana TaxID=6978 RepID=UPI0037E989D4